MARRARRLLLSLGAESGVIMELQELVRSKLNRRYPRAPAGLREPPELSGGKPLLGHTMEFARETIELLFRAHRELGEVASFRAAHKRIVAMFGPEAHEAVFRAPDEQLNPAEAYQIMVPVFGKDVVYDAPADKRNEQLKMLLPALKDRRMRSYGEIIREEVTRAVGDWGDEGEIDLVDFCRVLTNFTSSHCLIGREFREGMSEEFARVYHDLEQGVTPVAYINPYLPLPSFRKRDKARERLNEMISSIIQERKRTNREGEDFLQTLMEARYKTGEALSDHEITGLLLAAMFAGHHTSSVTTAWALIELLRNPQYLEGVKAELAGVFGDDGVVDYQSLRHVTRTERVIKETLRLHPPLFVLMRAVLEDFQYKDYHVPAGSMVAVSPTVAHRMPEYFANPDAFDPDRFAPGREEDKVPFAYIPFGGGRHKCMGNAFAQLQIKAILSVLLRNFEFELLEDDVESDFQGLVMGPKEPVRLRYHRRQRSLTADVPDELKPQPETAASTSGLPAIVSVEVDRDLCQGHSVCIEEAPSVFQVDAYEKAVVLKTEPDPSEQDRVRTAARNCPTGAIKLVTEDQATRQPAE